MGKDAGTDVGFGVGTGIVVGVIFGCCPKVFSSWTPSSEPPPIARIAMKRTATHVSKGDKFLGEGGRCLSATEAAPEFCIEARLFWEVV